DSGTGRPHAVELILHLADAAAAVVGSLGHYAGLRRDGLPQIVHGQPAQGLGLYRLPGRGGFRIGAPSCPHLDPGPAVADVIVVSLEVPQDLPGISPVTERAILRIDRPVTRHPAKLGDPVLEAPSIHRVLLPEHAEACRPAV